MKGHDLARAVEAALVGPGAEAQRLHREGWRPVSNKYRMIARVPLLWQGRAKQALAQMGRPLPHCKEWECADWYRRCVSKGEDQRVVVAAVYNALKGLDLR